MTPTATASKERPGFLVKLDPDTHAAAKAKAEATGSTVAAVLRVFLKAWLDAPGQSILLPTVVAPPSEDKPST